MVRYVLINVEVKPTKTGIHIECPFVNFTTDDLTVYLYKGNFAIN